MHRPSHLAAAATPSTVAAHCYPPEVSGQGWGLLDKVRDRHCRPVRKSCEVRRATWPPPQELPQRRRLGTTSAMLQKFAPVTLSRRRVHGVVGEGICVQIRGDDARSKSS